MGWSSGTDVCIEIWKAIRWRIPTGDREFVLADIITVLTNHDWDCVNEIESEKWPEIKDALIIAGYGEEN